MRFFYGHLQRQRKDRLKTATREVEDFLDKLDCAKYNSAKDKYCRLLYLLPDV